MDGGAAHAPERTYHGERTANHHDALPWTGGLASSPPDCGDRARTARRARRSPPAPRVPVRPWADGCPRRRSAERAAARSRRVRVGGRPTSRHRLPGRQARHPPAALEPSLHPPGGRRSAARPLLYPPAGGSTDEASCCKRDSLSLRGVVRRLHVDGHGPGRRAGRRHLELRPPRGDGGGAARPRRRRQAGGADPLPGGPGDPPRVRAPRRGRRRADEDRPGGLLPPRSPIADLGSEVRK